jgi:hypothetical protein
MNRYMSRTSNSIRLIAPRTPVFLTRVGMDQLLRRMDLIEPGTNQPIDPEVSPSGGDSRLPPCWPKGVAVVALPHGETIAAAGQHRCDLVIDEHQTATQAPGGNLHKGFR